LTSASVETSHRNVLLAALTAIAVLGSLFLLQSVFFGCAIRGRCARACTVLGARLA
jgi:hypothetical protein